MSSNTANLRRVTAKVFAGDAPSSAVGQFGSALNGTKVNTTDIATIQGLEAYEQGWSSAVVTNRNYPTLEEMNGVMKAMSYQTAYNMQKGVAEWDVETTYFSGDICKAVGSGILYVSRSDNNIGNPLTDTAYWQEYQGSASSIPATNYIAEINGSATFSNNTVTLPEMTLYIPNGRSGNGTLDNVVENVPSNTYTVSGNGNYTLFYNNDTKELLLAPNYQTRLAELPETGNYDDVAYLLDNKMYVVESTNPNYVESDGVTVSSSGVVSNLGTLSAQFTTQIPSLPVLNLDFTTGSDVTTVQSLFSLPYAQGNISNGSLDITISSLAYAVNYFTQVYSGAYTLTNQAVTYSYLINDTTYYTKAPIQIGISVYEDAQFETLYGKVTSIDEATVTIQNNDEDVYSGAYTDTSTRIYTYTLGENTLYSSGVLIPGLTVYINSELTVPFGVVENITTQNVVIHSTQSNIGYVAISGSGAVPANNPIYSDVNLQNEITTTTGANATFSGNSAISQVGTLTFEIAASTNYAGTLSFNSTSYTLVLNSTSTALLSSRTPYVEQTPAIVFGGKNGFLGTINLSGTSLENVWKWNGYNTVSPDWTAESLCKIGSITLANNEVTELNLDNAIELVKMSDLDNLNLSSSGGLGGLVLGQSIPLDRILTYEDKESTFLALQGSYVYKTGVQGSRYGYPTFYEKWLAYYKDNTNTTKELNSINITINTNGLKFYNIKDKAVIDDIYNQTGIADYYGIDEENERIFLPRNDKFMQFTCNTEEINDFIQAELPNVTGEITAALCYDAVGNDTKNSAVYSDNRSGHQYTLDNARFSFSNLKLDLSRNNSIYSDDCDTVQPASSKKLLYYVVGNTAEVEHISTTIPEGEALNQIYQNKSDITTLGDNIPLMSVQAVVPDYSAGITAETSIGVERSFTAPCYGIITYNLSAYNASSAYIKVNEAEIARSLGYGNSFNSITGSTLVSKGDTITYYSGYGGTEYNSQNIILYPCKGAK